jgi:hypothetical protein
VSAAVSASAEAEREAEAVLTGAREAGRRDLAVV